MCYNINKIKGLGVGTKMEEFIRLLDEHLAHIRHEIIGDTIYVHVKSNRDQ